MTRLLGILMLVLTLIFATRASAQESMRCHVQGPKHATQVGHDPSQAHIPAPGADHATMSGYCKLVCGTAALIMPASSPAPVPRAAIQEPLPAVRPVLSLTPAPSEGPPRSVI